MIETVEWLRVRTCNIIWHGAVCFPLAKLGFVRYEHDLERFRFEVASPERAVEFVTRRVIGVFPSAHKERKKKKEKEGKKVIGERH